MTVRVRIAPAPSGFLHVGSVRTALYNWLHARATGGVFVVRIEDTDADRATEESAASMLDAMRWVGLDWDEGVQVEGPYGPYRQSERAALYAAVAKRLEAAGHTWRDHRTPEELDAFRTAQRAADQPPAIHAPADGSTPGDPANPSVLRLRLPTEGTIVVDDLVKGPVTWDWSNESDPVLQRGDGSATYPLANTVDDVAHGITLICRGEDLLSVTPRQVVLHEMLTADGLIDEALAEVGLPPRDPSWEKPAQFAHLGLIVGADRAKLSKRHGSVAIQEFARQGYLPEAIRNYLALLGWSPGDGRERLTDAEMIASFSFDNVGKAHAMFDPDKLTAFNGERIRGLDAVDLAGRLLPFLDGTFQPLDDDGFVPPITAPASAADLATLAGLVPLVQERMQRLDEVQGYAAAFFSDGVTLDEGSVAKFLSKPGAREVLEAAREDLAALGEYTDASVEQCLRDLKDRLEMGAKKVFQPVRVAVTGSAVSPPLFESIALIGRERVLARIDTAIPLAMPSAG